MSDKFKAIDEAVQEHDGPGPDFLAGWIVGKGLAQTVEEADRLVEAWAESKEPPDIPE